MISVVWEVPFKNNLCQEATRDTSVVCPVANNAKKESWGKCEINCWFISICSHRHYRPTSLILSICPSYFIVLLQLTWITASARMPKVYFNLWCIHLYQTQVIAGKQDMHEPSCTVAIQVGPSHHSRCRSASHSTYRATSAPPYQTQRGDFQIVHPIAAANYSLSPPPLPLVNGNDGG